MEYESSPIKRFNLVTEKRPTTLKFELVKQQLEKEFNQNAHFQGI